MTTFEQNYFEKLPFTKSDIDQYLKNASRDLEIARKVPIAEVRFSYAYQALIKAGIALIAKKGGVKVRSVPGHHVKILEKTKEILNAPDVFTLGNAMRMKRNADFYGGGEIIGEKEAGEYFSFVESVIQRINKEIKV